MKRALSLFVICASTALVAAAALGQEQPQRARESSKVTLVAESEPVLSVLRRLCQSQGYNFVADDAALQKAGKVTLSLTDVSFDDALEAICDAYGLEGRVRGLDAHPIVVIKLQKESARDRERPFEAGPEPRGRRFLEGTSGPSAPLQPRVERTPAPVTPVETPATTPAAAPVTSQVAAQAPAQAPQQPAPPGKSALLTGIVVDVSNETLTIKGPAGDPREFSLPAGDNDTARADRLTRGLSHLKKGDKVSLEYRPEGGKLVMLNLVGGGKPALQTP